MVIMITMAIVVRDPVHAISLCTGARPLELPGLLGSRGEPLLDQCDLQALPCAMYCFSMRRLLPYDQDISHFKSIIIETQIHRMIEKDYNNCIYIYTVITLYEVNCLEAEQLREPGLPGPARPADHEDLHLDLPRELPTAQPRVL